MTNKKAWVTLATNDTYCLGALVLAQSLKKVNTTHDLVILITSSVTYAMRGTLQSVFNNVKEVNLLDSGDVENLKLLARPELGITFTKLHCWRLTQYEKCVFLDADTLVLQNCDELFDREELSAAPDVGWPDCFNSGVFVFKPSEETYRAIVDFALAHGSFDGGDQGLLNMFFSDWATSDSSKRLPFLYNLSSAAIYSYLPAFKWFGKGVKIIHFIGGNAKPWLQSFNSVTRTVSTDPSCSHIHNFMQYWWDLFCATVYPGLSPEMAGLANTFSQMKLEEPSTEQQAREDFLRRQNWEHGNIDYMGRDSFDNILSKINQTISKQSEPDSVDAAKPVSADALSGAPSPTDSESTEVPTTEKSVAVVKEEKLVAAPASEVTEQPPASCPKPAVEIPPSAPTAPVQPPIEVPSSVLAEKSSAPPPETVQPPQQKPPSIPTAAEQPSVEQPPPALEAVPQSVEKQAPAVTKQPSAEKSTPPAPSSPAVPESCPLPPVTKDQTAAEAPVSCPKPVAPVAPIPPEAPVSCPKPVAPTPPEGQAAQTGVKSETQSESTSPSAAKSESSQKAAPSRQSSAQESQGKQAQKSGKKK